MLNKIEEFITGLGVWNHAFIASIGMWPMAVLIHLANGMSWISAVWVAHLLWSFGYFMKEQGTSQYGTNLTEFEALDPRNWKKIDRDQTILVWVVTFALNLFNSLITLTLF